MRPLDGPISPGGEPEPTEAEFRADWAIIRAMGEEYADDAPESDEPAPEARLRDAAMIEEFVRRHRRRLEQKGISPEGLIRKARAVRGEIAQAQATVRKAEENALQARAQLADAERQATVSIFRGVAQLKAQWPSMTPEQRAKAGPILEQFARNREKFLAEMPIEERRRLEEEFPL
jgi:hypothetical protein